MAKKPNSRTVQVDFEGVETGGGSGFHIPEGQYGVKVDEVKKGISQNDNEMLEWIFTGTEGKARGKRFYFYTTITTTSLWKLRETLEGLGVEVPDSVMDIELDELEGLEGVGEIVDDEYRGKTRSKLDCILRNGAAATDTEEEEKPAKKKKSAPKLTEDDVNEMSEDELDGVVDKYSLGVDLSDFKTLSRKRAAIVKALTSAGMIE